MQKALILSGNIKQSIPKLYIITIHLNILRDHLFTTSHFFLFKILSMMQQQLKGTHNHNHSNYYVSGSFMPSLNSRAPKIQVCLWNRDHLCLIEVSACAFTWGTHENIGSDLATSWEQLSVSPCHLEKEDDATVHGHSFPLVRILSYTISEGWNTANWKFQKEFCITVWLRLWL